MSLSDFTPQRFALNYDPPMIILEYLVPSTGKLYHHKMKLRRLTSKSTVPECVKYLQQRHPLYFLNRVIKPDQIIDLVQKLIFRVKQNEELKAPASVGKKAGVAVPLEQKEPAKPLVKAPVFQSGKALPAIDDSEDDEPPPKKDNFPSLTG